MTHEYDVIICGGGLAGSAAALSLVRRGLSVAILDRATFPRKKLCGGLLTWKSIQLLQSHFGESVESLTDAGAINHVSDRYRINSFKGALTSGTLPYPFHFVDRAIFDKRLLDHAVNGGATLFQSTKVVSCDTARGIVTCENGEQFQGKHVIGADGANSVVRSGFPYIDRDRFKKYMAPTIEISLPPSALPRPVEDPELYVGVLDAGYGWVFPNRDRVIVGICGLRQENINFSKLFREYLDFLEIDETAVAGLHGHPLPYGNYLDNPVHGVTLLAGDAGGFVEPLFGEGIFFAMCTGMYAGDAVADALATEKNPGPVYRQRLETHIMPELRASDTLRWALFKSVKLFGPLSLGMFVKAGRSPLAQMVHGMRSYAWLRKKTWDF